MAQLARTELPYQVKIACRLTTGVGKEGEKLMDRVGSLGTIPNPLYSSPSLLDLSFLPTVLILLTNPLNFANFLSYNTTHPYLNLHYHTLSALSYPTSGLVQNKAETIRQIRPKRPRTETWAKATQGQRATRPKLSSAKTTRYRIWEKSFKHQNRCKFVFGYP